VEHGPEGLEAVPYRFTGKELDEETGLYYYGARYLNPRTSRWISADPGLEAFLPVAPINDEARKHNKDLPGGGGIFNPVNLAIYQYAGNNPLKYVDPDGTEKKSVQEVLRSAWNLLRGFFEGKPTAVGAEGSLAVPLPFVGIS
jgi:RHS repeat-associated protein